MNLGDFIMLRHEAMSADLCDRLVHFFEDTPSHHTRARGGDQALFTSLDLTALASTNDPDCTRLQSEAVQALSETVEFYRENIPYDTLPPKEEMAWEHVRLKRYTPGTDEQFPLHVDVKDLASSKRALAFFCYLNDVEEGGETTFEVLGAEVKPTRGSVLVFPPLWLYPHAAKPVVSGPKYLCQSYLHYT